MKNLYKIEDELYIISDTENVNENCWIITDGRLVQVSYLLSNEVARGYKVILTTNKLLIKDGVQSIDDELLEWFIKNPTCEFVKIHKEKQHIGEEIDESYPKGFFDYKIIIPQEEPKQETLEEAAKNWGDKFYGEYDDIREYMASAFVKGAKWQAERMYSEDDLRKAFKHGILFKKQSVSTCEEAIEAEFSMLVEQFKKK